jgi:tetraacyldisaccharide 4'-kinase
MKSSTFDIPIISVGNLSVGGTGKTPHIEYLVRLLNPYIPVATLSRGYGRKTQGFRFVELDSTPQEVGDEPLQFKLKFPDVPVAVGENRAFAIPKLLQQYWHVKTILLDDAFQHLAVEPYLNILLTDYERPFTRDLVLPAGMLREWPSGYQRADIIIVTKCPDTITKAEKAAWLKDLNPFDYQTVFFTKFGYKKIYPLSFQGNHWSLVDKSTLMPTPNEKQPKANEIDIQLSTNLDVVLLCAIARADYLLKYLKQTVRSVKTMEFEDHRFFTNYDMAQTKKAFDELESKNKIIITTEKDMVRLVQHNPYIQQNNLPIYILPIEVEFLFNEGYIFDEELKEKLLAFKI